jgi:hypothetical protein
MDGGGVALRWDTRCGIIIAGIDVAGLVETFGSGQSAAGDILARLEFPCISWAMSRTHGTSSGDVCRLISASSCTFEVVSLQIKTCSS